MQDTNPTGDLPSPFPFLLLSLYWPHSLRPASFSWHSPKLWQCWVYILKLYYVEGNGCVQFQVLEFKGRALIGSNWFLDQSASILYFVQPSSDVDIVAGIGMHVGITKKKHPKIQSRFPARDMVVIGSQRAGGLRSSSVGLKPPQTEGSDCKQFCIQGGQWERSEPVDCVRLCVISSAFHNSAFFLSLFIQLGLPGSVQVVSLRLQFFA